MQDSVFLNQGSGTCPEAAQPAACADCASSWLAEAFQFKDDRAPWLLWAPTSTMYSKVRTGL